MNPHYDNPSIEGPIAGMRTTYADTVRALVDTVYADHGEHPQYMRGAYSILYTLANLEMPPAHDRDLGLYQLQCAIRRAIISMPAKTS